MTEKYQQAPRGYGNGIAFVDLAQATGSMSQAEFEDQYGNAFLMLTANATGAVAAPSTTEVLLGDDDFAAERTASLSQLIYRIQPAERSAGHLVTIGRTSNNDVVIPDLSVSRFHAFAKAGSAGAVALQDANSANGTTVNGVSVPTQGHGAPVELENGDNVRLGRVELTFLDAAALGDFLRAHG